MNKRNIGILCILGLLVCSSPALAGGGDFQDTPQQTIQKDITINVNPTPPLQEVESLLDDFPLEEVLVALLAILGAVGEWLRRRKKTQKAAATPTE